MIVRVRVRVGVSKNDQESWGLKEKAEYSFNSSLVIAVDFW